MLLTGTDSPITMPKTRYTVVGKDYHIEWDFETNKFIRVPGPMPNPPPNRIGDLGKYQDHQFQTKTDRKQDKGLIPTKSPPEPEHGKNWSKGQGNSQKGRRDSRKTKNQVLRLANRDGMFCHWCGCELSYLEPMRQHQRSDREGNQLAQYPTIDHVIEWAISRDHSDDNCVLSCQPCNGARSKEFARQLNRTNNPKKKKGLEAI